MNAVMNLQIIATGRNAMAAIERVDRRTQRLTKSMGAATLAAGRMNTAMRMRNLDRFAKDLQWVGRQIEFNFTLPLVVAGGFMMKWALDNERAMTRVAKVYNEVEGDSKTLKEELDGLATSFRLISDITGIAQDEVISLGAAFAQAGANGAALGEATRLAAEAMVLGDLDAEEAVMGLIAVQQQYQLAIEDSGEATFSLRDAVASLNAIENATAVSMQDLITGLRDAGGVARGSGVTINELSAMMASLVPAAADASEAGNGLKTIITRLMAPSTQAKAALGALDSELVSSSFSSLTFTERLEKLAGALDNVSQSEQQTAMTMIFGRRQVNRAQIGLEDLVEIQGKYETALEATASQAKALATFERELRVYYQSNPQKLAILTSQMKNYLTEAIQPLIPYVIELLGGLRNMMKAFVELPVGTQRAIAYTLLFVASLGTLMRVGGAFLLLFSRMGLFVLAFGRTFGKVGKYVMRAAGMMGAVVKGVFVALAAPLRFAMLAFMGLGRGVVITMQFIKLAIARGMAVALATMGGGFAKILTVFRAFAVAMATGWARFWGGLVFLMKSPVKAMVAVAAGGWRALIMFFTTGFGKLGSLMLRGFMLVFASPLGLAIAAALGLIYLFRDQIKGLIDDLIQVWYQLPHGVVGALKAVVEVVKKAALAVYEWLSWMNPFARHSPSLVENVKNGVAIIGAEYAKLNGIGKSFKGAIQTLKDFNAATAEARKAARSADFGEDRAAVGAVAPGALDEFDRMVSGIYELESALGGIQREYDMQARVVNEWETSLANANFELEAQQLILSELESAASNLQNELSDTKARLDELASTPIQGMQAYSDAIFENQMAQNALRLEMLKIEDAYGTVEGLQDRMAGLSGDIEMLNGNRESLRAAGAGSDVLDALDGQIAVLEDERRALNSLDSGPMAEMADLEKQLADLQRQGEILSLEESLAFDPLTRELEQLVNGVEEVPFDQLLADIKSTQDEVASLTKEYDEANAAVARQQTVVDNLTTTRDAIQSTYDMEVAKLGELEAAYNGIENQIDAMTDALSQFARTAATLSGGGGSGGGAGGADDFGILGPPGNFDIPGGGAAGITGGDLDALNADLEAELDAMFGEGGIFDFNMKEAMKAKWDEAVEWMKTKWNDFKTFLADNGIDVDAIIGGLGEAFGTFFEGIRERISEIFGKVNFESLEGKLSDLKTFFQPVITALSEFWDMVEGFFFDTLDEVKDNWTLTWDDMSQYFEAAKNVWTGIIAVLVGAFTLIWPTVRNVFRRVLDWISEIIGDVVQIFQGFVKLIGGLFTGDVDQIMRGLGDIFAGAFEAIVTTVTYALGLVWDIVSGLVEGVYDFFVWLFDVLVGNSIIPDMVDAIVEWFAKMRDWIVGIWTTIKEKAVEIWEGIRDAVVNKYQELKQKLENAMWKTERKIKEIWEAIRLSVYDKIQGVRDILATVGGYLSSLITTPFQAARNAVRDTLNSLKGIVASIWNGIAETINGAIRGIVNSIESMVDAFNGVARRLNLPTITFDFDVPEVPVIPTPPTNSGRRGGGVFAMADGAVLRRPTMGLMAEYAGASRNPEIVTPERLMRQVFSDTLESYGGGGGGTVVINGDLSFPNISDGRDAEDFVRNLEAMVD